MNYKHIIKEAIGVSEDVKSLAEFLHGELNGYDERNKIEKDFFLGDISFDDYVKLKSELKDKPKQKPGRKIYTSDQLPMLKNMNVSKMVVDSVKKKTSNATAQSLGHFNAGKSYDTPNGSIIYLKFFGEPDKSTIYHELTHVLQFSKIGQEKMAKGLKPSKKVGFSSGFVTKPMSKEEKEVIEYFSYYVYQSQEHEITAKVTETYSTIKERLDNSSIYNKANSQELVNAFFKTVLESTYGYKVADYMINYDIFEAFKKLDDDVTIKFFSHIADMDKYVTMQHKTWPRFKEIFTLILRGIVLNKKPHKLRTLSDDEVLRLMKEYNDFINKQGWKLKRKLIKLYAHFL